MKTPTIIEKPLTNDKAVQQLSEFYANGQKEIEKVLLTPVNSPTEKAKNLKKIETISDDLLVGTRKWIEVYVPATYQEGAEFAVKNMEKTGMDPKITEGFSVLQKEALQDLSDGIYTTMKASLDQLEKRTKNTILRSYNIKIEDELLAKLTAGESRERIEDFITSTLDKNGVTMIVDRGGKRWNMQTYAEMVARTSRTDVFNNAIANRALENGFDLVQITRHDSKHEACRVWESKIVSLTGATKGYPTLQDAQDAGLLHPNCKHTFTAIDYNEARDLE